MPMLGQPVCATPMVQGQMTCSSIPATPIMNWGDLPTPSATPFNGSMYNYVKPEPKPEPPKPALSLSGMIQSPKGEHKTMLLNSAYQNMYQPPPQQPMTMQVMPATSYAAPIQQAPTMTYSLPHAQMAQPQPVMQYSAPPTAQPAQAISIAPAEPKQKSAAQMLGLMMSPRGPSHISLAPVGTMAGTVPGSGYPSHFMPPPSAHAPMVMMGQPPAAPAMYPQPLAPAPFAPPPPTHAPTVVSSEDNDMQVLMDMAMASGNQRAVDAVMRQRAGRS